MCWWVLANAIWTLMRIDVRYLIIQPINNHTLLIQLHLKSDVRTSNGVINKVRWTWLRSLNSLKIKTWTSLIRLLALSWMQRISILLIKASLFITCLRIPLSTTKNQWSQKYLQLLKTSWKALESLIASKTWRDDSNRKTMKMLICLTKTKNCETR